MISLLLPEVFANSLERTSDHEVHCLDLATGERVWKYGDADMFRPKMAVSGDIVRIGEQQPAYLDLRTGAPVAKPAEFKTTAISSTLQLDLPGIIAASHSKKRGYIRPGTIYASGVRWRFDSYPYLPSPECPDVMAMHTDNYHWLYLVIDENLFALQSQDGELQWHTQLPAQAGDPWGKNYLPAFLWNVPEGLLALCGSAATLLDPETGAIHWCYHAADSVWSLSQITQDGYLLISARSGAGPTAAPDQHLPSPQLLALRKALMRLPLLLLPIPLIVAIAIFARRRQDLLAPGPWLLLIMIGLAFSWPWGGLVMTTAMRVAHFANFAGYLLLIPGLLWRLTSPAPCGRNVAVTCMAAALQLAALSAFFIWCRA
jgi:hypothetical protein